MIAVVLGVVVLLIIVLVVVTSRVLVAYTNMYSGNPEQCVWLWCRWWLFSMF